MTSETYGPIRSVALYRDTRRIPKMVSLPPLRTTHNRHNQVVQPRSTHVLSTPDLHPSRMILKNIVEPLLLWPRTRPNFRHSYLEAPLLSSPVTVVQNLSRSVTNRYPYRHYLLSLYRESQDRNRGLPTTMTVSIFSVPSRGEDSHLLPSCDPG